MMLKKKYYNTMQRITKMIKEVNKLIVKYNGNVVGTLIDFGNKKIAFQYDDEWIDDDTYYGGIMDKLVLIDGHSILNRAFYGIPDELIEKAISETEYSYVE